MSRVKVEIDPKDARSIIDVDLTRDECEGIYAMCHVLANVMGDRGEILKSGMLAVLDQFPKDTEVVAAVPFTAEAAASVLSLCYFAVTIPDRPCPAWVAPLLKSIGDSLKGSGTHASIAIDGRMLFSSP